MKWLVGYFVHDFLRKDVFLVTQRRRRAVISTVNMTKHGVVYNTDIVYVNKVKEVYVNKVKENARQPYKNIVFYDSNILSYVHVLNVSITV